MTSNDPQQTIEVDLWLEAFERSGEAWLQVTSGSMAPTLIPGDRVLVKKASAGDVTPGEIIVFWQQDILVSHRLYSKWHRRGRLRLLQGGETNHFGIIDHVALLGRITQATRKNNPLSSLTFTHVRLSFFLSFSSLFFYALDFLGASPLIGYVTKVAVRKLRNNSDLHAMNT